jgi:hypothetical protein
MMAAFSEAHRGNEERTMAPSAVPGFPPGPVTVRQNVRGQARATVTMLAVIITLNLAGIAAGTAREWPGFLDIVWLVLLGVTGIVFLTWFAPARRNTASYGPDRVRAYPEWTVAGWFCPIACAWIPYQITAEILRASSIPASSVPPPASVRSATALVRWWWTLWIGMWVALWAFLIVYLMAGNSGWGVTTPQILLDLAFQLLSIAAAACTIAVVLVITRLQAQRAAEPEAPSERLPRSAPRGLMAAAAALTVLASPFLLVLVFIGARDTTSTLLPPAGLAPTRAEITGTWHASDGGVLVFNSDGQFTGTGLSMNLANGDAPTATRWSGTGTWQTGGTCDASAPGICLTTGSSASYSEDGWTEGPASSPILLLPAADFGSSGYTYELQK